MSKFTSQYVQLLKTESRISKSGIKPRNIYRLSVYKDGDPKSVKRFVFVIGIIDKKVHCIKLNDIRPLDFMNLLFKLRDKRIPIGSDQALELLLKRFSKDGNALFESFVKNNSKLYSSQLKNYRTYILDKITNAYEIRFEEDFLRELFKEGQTQSTLREDIKEEVQEDTELNE